eukprot:scaffold9105_cov151-Amphora_coffeaeformis.AAC.3
MDQGHNLTTHSVLPHARAIPSGFPIRPKDETRAEPPRERTAEKRRLVRETEHDPTNRSRVTLPQLVIAVALGHFFYRTRSTVSYQDVSNATQKHGSLRNARGLLGKEHAIAPAKCEAIIEFAEKKGFEPALLNVGGGRQIYAPDTRNSKRTIIDDNRFAECILKRIQHLLPKTSHAGFQATGINERMRVLRYGPGDAFQPHCDGSYVRPDGSQASFWTVMIYLNEKFEGGSTLFHSTRSVTGDDDEVVAVVPKSGSVLLFDHSLYHEGEKVLRGTKYAIRTDMMFRKF